MRNLFALIVSCAAIVSATSFAQEIPADLKAQISAKAKELHPDNQAAAKSWQSRQIEAWETIQNMTFPVDEEELNLIKAAAQKKFPYEYSKQENFISEQANLAAGMSEYKTQFGLDTYKALRKALEAKGITDLNEVNESLRKQLAAKLSLDSFRPAGVDQTTLNVAKEVVAKLLPGDFEAQLKQLKTQFKVEDAQEAKDSGALHSSPIAGGSPTQSLQDTKRNIPISERQKIARDTYQKQTFLVDGAVKCAAITIELNGRQVLLAPFSAYSTNGMTISNTLGEQIEFDIGDIVASKELPLIAILPKSIPQDMRNTVLLDEREYRSILGKNSIVVGYYNSTVTSFPVKVSAISNPILTLSSKIPPTYSEGALVIESENYATVGMLFAGKAPVGKIRWSDRAEINKLKRNLAKGNSQLICARIDKLSSWEKINLEKFSEQKSKLEALKTANNEIMELISKKRLSDFENNHVLGKIAQKYIREFRNRMDESRFMRIYRGYAQDIITILKIAMRDMDPKEYYTVFRGDIVQQMAIANGLISAYTEAMSGGSEDLTPDEIKKNQSRR